MKNNSTHILTSVLATSFLIAANSYLCANETDDRIEESTRKSFVFRTFLKEDSVKTESKDGAVTLTGTVAHGFHKSLAEDTVAVMPAVKSVDNQIVVKTDSPVDTADRLLAQQVKTILIFHRNLNPNQTDVAAKDGKITLTGTAKNQAQKELTTEYAKDAEGVKDVDNQMAVVESKTTPERTIAERIDDASITAQVKTSLLTHRSTSAVKTHIQTSEGVVTVSGVAGNAAEKSLVTKLINDIDGVMSVENNMTL
jgi:hyperosmotically inducible protein